MYFAYAFLFFYSMTNEIALGEAWAYHLGHFLADQRWCKR